MPQQFLTAADVARKLGVSKQRVKVWLDEGRIRVVARKPNGDPLIAVRDAKRPKKIKPGPKTGK